MTRDEAIEKARAAYGPPELSGFSHPPAAAFVDMAVALGLITLDEPKVTPSPGVTGQPDVGVGRGI